SPREVLRAEPRHPGDQRDAAHVLASGGGRSGRSGRELARLLLGAQEGWRSRRDARVCEGWACLWASADRFAHHAVAAARGDVDGGDRHDFEVDLRTPLNEAGVVEKWKW